MTYRIAIAVVAAVAIIGYVLVRDRREAPAEAPPTTAPAEEPAPAAEPAPGAEAAQPTGAPEAERPHPPGVPVLDGRDVAWISVDVRTHPEPGQAIRVSAGELKAEALRSWEDLCHVAAFAAIEGAADVPAGLRIEVTGAPKRVDPLQMASLVLAIRLGLAGQPWPAGQVASGVVAPDGTIVTDADGQRAKSSASAAGLTLVDARSVEQVLTTWGLAARQPPSAAPDLSGAEPHRRTSDGVVAAVTRISGEVLAHRPASLPLPEDWRDVVARVEARLQSADLANQAEALSFAYDAARVRDAVRSAQWAEGRVGGWTGRMLQNRTDLAGPPLVWLTLLVQARVEGEADVRGWLASQPEARPAPRPFEVPAPWLDARIQRLRDVAQRFDRILGRRIRRADPTTRPYPRQDPRDLAWPAGGPPPSRAPVADWGDLVAHVSMLWAQVTILTGLHPTPSSESADPGQLNVADERLLRALIGEGRRTAGAAAGRARDRTGRVPKPSATLLASVPRDGGPDTAARIAALESLWTATAWAREAVLLHSVAGGRR